MRARVLPVLLLLGPLVAACTDGAGDGTLLTDVTVVHVGAAPPEVAPGEPVDLLVTSVDPLDEGVALLTWACTDLGEGCVEEQGQPLSERVVLEPRDGEDLGLTLTVDPALAALLQLDTELRPPMVVWTLACGLDTCPVIDLIDRSPEPGSDDDAAVRAFLADPTAGLADLPLAGVSLVRRQLPLTDLPIEERNANPVVGDLLPQPLVAASGGEVLLEFSLWDDDPGVLDQPGLATLYGFATIGGISPARQAVTDGPLSWVAGDQPGTGMVYVVALDGQGGSALWRSEVVVE